MRPISGKHECLLKFFWNLKGQVTHENRPVFEFQIRQVTRDNETNFREVECLLKFFWNLKGHVTTRLFQS
jgi:hypothetical protein